jgi:hypothetical protein
MQNYRKFHVAATCLVFTLLTSGCASRGLIAQNEAAGHQLAVLFKTIENTSSEPDFPRSLSELSQELRALGSTQSIPQCECADWALRDFIYIPGYTAMDDERSIFLHSPPEMGVDRSILVRINTSTLVLPNEQASDLIKKSHEFVAHSKNPPPTRP